MTKPAAIQASYADYRRVKGRKVLQLIFEVPLEQAPQVHEAFGEPLPDGTTWVAVARIDKTVAEMSPQAAGGFARAAALEPERRTEIARNAAKKRWGDLPLVQRAAIMCEDKTFLQFLKEDREYSEQLDIANGDVPSFVRHACMVNSRSELDSNEFAGKAFIKLERKFQAWKLI